MAKMFLMCGNCGSGKTTYAKQFAKINHLYYLSIDDTYREVNKNNKHENKELVWQIFFNKIQQAQQNQYDIIIDTNAPTESDRTEFITKFPKFESHLIWVDTDLQLCLQNNKNRERIIIENYLLQTFKLFEYPTLEEYYKQKEWLSFSLVINNNNKFLPRITLCGIFPNDIKDLN